jgi:hypothetical protein
VEALFRAANGVLSDIGWKVMVVGGLKIQHQPDAPTFKYELVLSFTGVNDKIESIPNQMLK